jgi:hypothetical protein
MNEQAFVNLNNAPRQVRHADLERFGDSVYKSQCPVCKEGLLLVRRDQETFQLLREDACSLCGQRFEYLDIDGMNQREQ